MTKQTVTVEVTQDDIDGGIPDCSDGCPIALSLYRLFPELVPDVMRTSIILLKPDRLNGHLIATRIPSEAYHFIRAFDSLRTVHPTSFDLELEELPE